MPNLSTLTKTLLNSSFATGLGDFQITEILGQGGAGIVFAATKNTKSFAIKFLVESSKQKRDRFVDEYLGSMQLAQHPNIVRPLHFGEATIDGKSFPYILMERYSGTLKRQTGTPSSDAVAKLVNELLDAIAHLHSNGIVHRDLKPSNIFVQNGSYIVGDLGIASFDPDLFVRNAATEKGERLANFEFSAPEQAQGAKAHPTMDFYAFGQIMQWYCTGRVHKGTSRQSISGVDSKLNRLDAATNRCLSNSPAGRPSSVAEIREILNVEEYSDDPIGRSSSKWDQLHLFEDALRKSFPKIGGSHVVLEVTQKNRLMKNIAAIAKEAGLWWKISNGGDMHCHEFTQLDAERAIWLFDGFEFKVDQIAIYRDDSCFANFLVLFTNGSPPFGIETPFRLSDDAGFWNGRYISRAEFNNGYAEIDGDIVELSDPPPEMRSRYLSNQAILIAPHASSAMNSESDGGVTRMLSYFNEQSEGVEIAKLKDFVGGFRHNIDEDVDILR